MKNLTENKIELGQNHENIHVPSNDDETETSSQSISIQESTLSMCTVNIQKAKELSKYETDINDQNILNKQNEKLIKPCKNGNCYCFTSDSDDFRIKKINKNRLKQNKMRKQEYESQQYNNKFCNRESDDIQSFTSLDSSDHIKNKRDLPSISKETKCVRKGNCEISPKYSLKAKSKTLICEKAKKGVPLIHIIQEFHKNSVISEIRINKSQIEGRQDKNNSFKKSTNKKIDLNKIDTKYKIHKLENHKSKDDFGNKDIFKEENFIHKNKMNLRNSGGKLYQKRIGCESNKHYKDYLSPPKKPPRSISSISEQSKIESEMDLITSLPKSKHNLDVFPKTNISEYNSHIRNIRKSFPIDNRSKLIDSYYNKKIYNTTCNCSRIENNEKPVNFGWVRPDTEIVQMLESNRKLSELQSSEQKPAAQIGWTIPPKLDIDTVDGISESLPNDSHNFAKNMESKSTPVKSDFSNETGNSFKEQLKDMISNSIKKDKKNYKNKLESNASFREKAKIGAKVFLVNSKQKLINMVAGKSDKEIPTKTNVAVQTSTNNLCDNTDSFLGNHSIDENNQSTHRFSLQSPHSKSSRKNTTEFDFNRTVNSPKSQRSTQRKLSFSPKKLIKNFSYRPVCIDHHPISDNHYYKSYDNHINKDFTLSSINDILLSIRAKLETTDNHAENTFREISDRENNFKKSFEIDEEFNKNEDLKNFCRISAQADIHNNTNPVYSECEEEKLVITGSPSNHSLNEISHYYIDENPYAIVKKVTKSSSNNIEVKKNPSQDLNLNLKGSESYQDSLTNVYTKQTGSHFRNDYSVDNITIKSFELFEHGNEVEYVSVNDISFNNYNMTPNRNTQLESKDESIFPIGQDTVDGLPNTQINVNLELESSFDHDLDKNKIIQKTGQKSNKLSPIIYKNIKKKFRESFYKSKKYLKSETNIFSNLTKSKDNNKKEMNNNSNRDKNNSTIWDESDLGIYDLYSETPSISEQLQKTVSLCRKIPYFDSTLEAVEAERLLLYSTLKTEKINNNNNNSNDIIQDNRGNDGKIYIDSFKLSISLDINRDIFFNYFYIAVFSYGSRIKSSNFAEKIDNTITFRNCNIIFDSLNENSKIKCDIYMLRLRKILNLNTKKNQEQIISKMENFDESYESSGEEFLSRFKLQSCFEFNPRNFIPYRIEESCKIAEINHMMCLHAKNNITLPLILVGRGTHLKNEIYIQAALEILFPKFEIEGFISVQDIKNQHNWNRFWCKLDYFVLKLWKYPQDCLEKDVIYSFDLCKCLNYPINVVDRSLCARLRSFFLTILIEKNDDDNNCYKNIFFSADNQDHLKFWINGINRILEFVNIWMVTK